MIDRLAQIRELIAQADYEEARRLALSGLDQSQDDETRARLIHNLALATHRAGDNPEALRILAENEAVFEIAPPLIRGNYHNELGIVLYNAGEIDRALVQYRKASEFYAQAGNESYRASVFNNISLALKDAGRVGEALLYNRKARQILTRTRDERLLADALDSYSIILAAQAESQVNRFSEQPIHTREIVTEPQSTRAP